MKFQFSAGGIVLRQAQDKFTKKGWEVLVCQHSQHHGWVFPKGLIGDHPSTSHSTVSPSTLSSGLPKRSDRIGSGQVREETKEETALREVKEETGADAKIIKMLTPVTYWFVFEDDPSTGSGREKIKKTVYYFLMEYVGGDITKHDHEMKEVVWLPKEKVEERLTYKSDKKVWQEALEILNLKF